MAKIRNFVRSGGEFNASDGLREAQALCSPLCQQPCAGCSFSKHFIASMNKILFEYQLEFGLERNKKFDLAGVTVAE